MPYYLLKHIIFTTHARTHTRTHTHTHIIFVNVYFVNVEVGHRLFHA